MAWPSTRRGLTAAAAVLAWLAAYLVNEPLWHALIHRLPHLDAGSKAGDGLHFLLYQGVKITLLLTGAVFTVAVARSYLNLDRVKALLGGRRDGPANLAAAVLGATVPVPVSSAVPAFAGFVAASVPLGVTLSFLIAGPLLNEVTVVLLYATFGFRIAALYVASGLLVAGLSGLLLGRACPAGWVESFVYRTNLRGVPAVGGPQLPWPERISMGRQRVTAVLRRVWPYLLAGVGLGAAVQGWAPAGSLAAGPDNLLAPIVAVLLGAPLGSAAVGLLPAAAALHAKGMTTGTVLAFVMSVAAFSLPELALLRRVLRPPLLATFVCVLTGAVVGAGCLLDATL